MNSINVNNIDAFCAWSEENEDKHIFPAISKDKESYYVDRISEDTYMMEYSFQTVAELKEVLEIYSGLALDKDMLKELTVRICQDRFRNELIGNDNNNIEADIAKTADDTKTLPEYIYIF